MSIQRCHVCGRQDWPDKLLYCPADGVWLCPRCCLHAGLADPVPRCPLCCHPVESPTTVSRRW